MDFDLPTFAIWYIVFLFSTTLHEFGHAYVAFRGGDETAYESGTMSLDPTPHIQRSPFGMVLVPLISYVQMGWVMGWASVPYDPRWGQRFPKRQALMSLAGPLSNFALALVGIAVLKALLAAGLFLPAPQINFSKLVVLASGATSGPLGALAAGLSILVNLNVILGLFNLMPIPPLDGAGVVEGLFPNSAGQLYEKLREAPMFQLLGLLIAWNLFPPIARHAFDIVVVLVHPDIPYS